MSQFGLEGESLFHLGQRCFLWSAQHDGYINHQTQQGCPVLEREREEKMDVIYCFIAVSCCHQTSDAIRHQGLTTDTTVLLYEYMLFSNRIFYKGQTHFTMHTVKILKY